MLIDCDTCTARGEGCADCVVTVLLGAPPDWHSADPVVVPLPSRATAPAAEDVVVPPHGVVVEFDDVERRAVRALADGGLIPPLRHRAGPGDADRGHADQGHADRGHANRGDADRGGAAGGRRTG
jgi:hypothetical protein